MQGKLLNKGLSRQEYMLLVMRCMHDHVTESRDKIYIKKEPPFEALTASKVMNCIPTPKPENAPRQTDATGVTR